MHLLHLHNQNININGGQCEKNQVKLLSADVLNASIAQNQYN